MAETYGAMQDRIASELVRTDLTSQIQLAIRSAIKKFERKRFYFNEQRITLTTSSGQEYYTSADNASIPYIAEFDSVRITVNGTTYTLHKRDYNWIDQIQSNASYTGDPTDYAYYGQQIRLYPIPYLARTVVLSIVNRFATLSATTDTNAWMSDGEELIRQTAKADLLANVIRNNDRAMVMDALATRARDDLLAESTQRGATGKLRPTSF